MSTDESYLDSLLNGLDSDNNNSNDRLSAFKKKAESVSPDDNDFEGVKDIVTDETNGISKDENQSAFEEKTEADDEKKEKTESEFFELVDTNENEPENLTLDYTAGEIDNYNIFDEYDDKVIDKMIDEELSREEDEGEPFVMSENNDDFANEENVRDEDLDFIYPEPESIRNEDEEDALAGLLARQVADLDAEEKESAYGDKIFGNFDFDGNSDETYAEDDKSGSEATAEEEEFDKSQNDLFSFLNTEEVETKEQENKKADTEEQKNEEQENEDTEFADSEDIFAIRDEKHEQVVFDDYMANEDNKQNKTDDDNLIDSNESNNNELSSDYNESESSILGLDSLFGPEPIEEISNKNSASDFLGDDAMDTLDESDIAALDDLFNEIDVTTTADTETKEEKSEKVKKNKVPWYIKIFGNVSIPEEKIKPEPTEEEIAKQKEEAKAAKKAIAEAKKAEKDEKKKAAAEAKAIKQRQSAEEKEAARKKKLEEASNLILEDAGNTKKLNKWGIIVVFCLFMGIVLLVVSGGNTVSYNIGIRQATKYFDNALVYGDVSYYTKAYDKIYGLDVEEEDYEIYDKILTVNYVNTQLTAYTSHAGTDDYAAGLNDLFKGLLRFRKWFAHATAIGAQDDIYLVRTEIYNKLWEIYGINEDEAMFVLEHYDYLKETYSENEANVYYTRYIYEKVDALGLGTGSTN